MISKCTTGSPTIVLSSRSHGSSGQREAIASRASFSWSIFRTLAGSRNHRPVPHTRVGLLPFDDHELVLVVVAEKEEERNRPVATHQFGIDVGSLFLQLRVVCTR